MKVDKIKAQQTRDDFDYKLDASKYIMIMLDGRSFSHYIKKKFKRPFDEKFMGYMDEVAKCLCEEIQCAVFAYTESDEISIIVRPNMVKGKKGETYTTAAFDARMCKLLSITAAIASAKFNRLVIEDVLKDTTMSETEKIECVSKLPLYQFDSKVWNVDTLYDAVSWIMYRNQVGINSSKQSAAQTYIPHKKLENVPTDNQVTMLKEIKGIDWATEYTDGMKYGRFIVKREVEFENEHGKFIRNKFCIEDAIGTFNISYEDFLTKYNLKEYDLV